SAIAIRASKLTFVSSSQISYQFNNQSDVGTWSVTVNNPDRKQSNAWSFTVTRLEERRNVTGLSPSSYPASNSNQTMTINGSNFVSGATLTFMPAHGSAIASTASKLTFISSNQISYQFNNQSDIGTWSVTVNNPDGKQSNAWSFTVT